jgi:hypothetical protein
LTRFEIGEDWTIAFLINHFSMIHFSSDGRERSYSLGAIFDRAEETRTTPSIVEK